MAVSRKPPLSALPPPVATHLPAAWASTVYLRLPVLRPLRAEVQRSRGAWFAHVSVHESQGSWYRGATLDQWMTGCIHRPFSVFQTGFVETRSARSTEESREPLEEKRLHAGVAKARLHLCTGFPCLPAAQSLFPTFQIKQLSTMRRALMIKRCLVASWSSSNRENKALVQQREQRDLVSNPVKSFDHK